MARRKRFTIEVYEGEEQILRKMKSLSFEMGVPFRDFAMQAIREKLARDAAQPEKKKK